MKKVILASAIALFGMMNAQKGSVLVGGDFSLSSQKETYSSTSNAKYNSVSFNPTIGYQFTDNVTAGVRFGLESGKIEETGGDNVKMNSLQYGVFGRYSMPLSDIFAVYGDLDVFASNGKTTTTVGSIDSTSKTTGFGVMFTPNMFINFKNSFGLNFNIGGLGYVTEKVKGTDYKNDTFGFSFGKGVTVGISKNFK